MAPNNATLTSISLIETSEPLYKVICAHIDEVHPRSLSGLSNSTVDAKTVIKSRLGRVRESGRKNQDGEVDVWMAFWAYREGGGWLGK